MRTLTDADRTASREVTLTADFAPHPENVVWENLGVSATSRYVRSTIVNGILLAILVGVLFFFATFALEAVS